LLLVAVVVVATHHLRGRVVVVPAGCSPERSPQRQAI
jgi:hypothetical protein